MYTNSKLSNSNLRATITYAAQGCRNSRFLQPSADSEILFWTLEKAANCFVSRAKVVTGVSSLEENADFNPVECYTYFAPTGLNRK